MQLLRPLSILGLGALLAACDSGDPAAASAPDLAPASRSREAFTREVLALKAAHKDPARLERAIADLVAGQGIPAPAGEIETASAGSDPLAKAAGYSLFKMKDFSGSTVSTFKSSVIVPAQSWVEIRTTSTGITDPYLAVYQLTGTGNAQTVKFHALDDSGGTLDAWITWRNETSSAITLQYVVFAHNASTRGPTDVTVTPEDGAPVTVTGVPAGGKVAYTNTGYATPGYNCYGPTQSKIRASVDLAEEHVEVLAANPEERTGHWLMATTTARENLGPLVPNKYPNFVVAYKAATGTEMVIGPAKFRAIHYDYYPCL